MQGDGDCLFHALAYFHSGDGGALRIDVADFLEAKALEQGGFEEAWLREAEKLRASAWGGHNAIVAYSLMQKVRVFLHIHQTGTAETTVTEQSHGLLIDRNDVPTYHVLYNGVDHYDALVPLLTTADREDLKPAWDNQPAPDAYLTKKTSNLKRGARASVVAEGYSKPKRRRFNAPRPRAATPKPKKPCKKPAPASSKEQTPKDKQEDPAPAMKHRRYTCKTTPPPELRDDILTEMAKVPVTATLKMHPHRKLEDMIKVGILTVIEYCTHSHKKKENFACHTSSSLNTYR